MAKIKGTTVILYQKTQTGVDAFGAPVYETQAIPVDNVLIGQPDTDDVLSSTDLFGKRIFCWLAIPKGDMHEWEDVRVDWTDADGRVHQLQTFGFAIMGIEANLPRRLPWHKKVRAAKYEQGQV